MHAICPSGTRCIWESHETGKDVIHWIHYTGYVLFVVCVASAETGNGNGNGNGNGHGSLQSFRIMQRRLLCQLLFVTCPSGPQASMDAEIRKYGISWRSVCGLRSTSN